MPSLIADSSHSGSDCGAVLPAAAAAASDRTVPAAGSAPAFDPLVPLDPLLPFDPLFPLFPFPVVAAGSGAVLSQVGWAADSGWPSRVSPSRVTGWMVTVPLVNEGAAGTALSSAGTRRCSSSGARSRLRSSSAHQSRPPGAARVRVEERSCDSRNRNASMRRARASSSHSIQFSR